MTNTTGNKTPTTDEPIKPGWQTSEAHVTIISAILVVVAMVCHLSPSQEHGLGNWLASAIPVVVTGTAWAVAAWKYIHSRTAQKVALIHGYTVVAAGQATPATTSPETGVPSADKPPLVLP